MAVDWENVGVARWYDCKLGRIKDQRLARLVGTTKGIIRYRRMLLGIDAWTVGQLIEPFRDLLGIESDPVIAARCGASAPSVRTYRESLGIAPKPRSMASKPPIPAKHPVKPYRQLLGLVADLEIASLAGVPVAVVETLRESLGIEPSAPLPEPPKTIAFPNYQGPWLGYESLFGTMSPAKISRAVGVPFSVVERRRQFLGVISYQRVSRVARYEHLLGVVSNGLLAKLAGVSPARIADIRKSKGV